MIFRLEYNSRSGGFHCEDESRKFVRPENTYGWATVAKRVKDPLSMHFTEAMFKKYPFLGLPREERIRGKHPSITTIRREFAAFKKSYHE
jgi:hypothetical protein